MKAVIFDMDGLLIDSEPMWKKAEKLVFSSVGVDVRDDLAVLTAPMTTKEVTHFWYNLNPWASKSMGAVENEVIDCVESFIREKGEPMPGVAEVLDLFHKEGFKIGLSTNSPSRLIPAVLDKLGISDYFGAVTSADQVGQGKPRPNVYLSTAMKLEVRPSACIAFEDSVSGIMAARAAGLKTVVVPEAAEFDLQDYEIADLKLRSLSEFNRTHLTQLRK